MKCNKEKVADEAPASVGNMWILVWRFWRYQTSRLEKNKNVKETPCEITPQKNTLQIKSGEALKEDLGVLKGIFFLGARDGRTFIVV